MPAEDSRGTGVRGGLVGAAPLWLGPSPAPSRSSPAAAEADGVACCALDCLAPWTCCGCCGRPRAWEVLGRAGVGG